MRLDNGHVHDHAIANGAAAGNTPEQRYRAARTVAVNAVDVGDCAELLAVLGLSAEDGLRKEAAA